MTDHDQTVMRSAKAPVGVGPAPLVAQLIALALVVLGAVGIEEVLVRTGAVSLPSWTSSAVDALDGIAQDSAVVLVVGVVAAVAGFLLLPVAFLRRPRTSVELSASTGVFLRRRDLARIAKAALEGTDAVTGVDVRSSRSRVRVTATTVAHKERNAAIVADVDQRLAGTLDALDRPPRTTVRVKNEGL